MSKAVLVAFFPYLVNKPTGWYWLWWSAWKNCFLTWAGYFDKLYLIDQDWGFTQEHLNNLPLATVRFDTNQLVAPIEHHWSSFAQVIPKIKEELIFMLDSDTLVYNPEFVKSQLLEMMEKDIDLSCIFDGSGGVSLKERFPLLAANQNRAERRRIAPYLCFIKKSLLDKTDLDFKPLHKDQNDWYDSFGRWTIQVLDQNPKILEIPDDRTTLFWSNPKSERFEKSTWLDGAGFAWSEPPDKTQSLGYYHIRNFSLGLYLVNTYLQDKPAFEKAVQTTPFWEAARQLAWLRIIDKESVLIDKIFPVLHKGWGVMPQAWNKYLYAFKNYHLWQKLL